MTKIQTILQNSGYALSPALFLPRAVEALENQGNRIKKYDKL